MCSSQDLRPLSKCVEVNGQLLLDVSGIQVWQDRGKDKKDKRLWGPKQAVSVPASVSDGVGELKDIF